ncbi:uncharacterized protein V3H86_013740, partial [Mergus octosetaceus]
PPAQKSTPPPAAPEAGGPQAEAPQEAEEEEGPQRAPEAALRLRPLLPRHPGRHQGPEPQRHLRGGLQDRGLHVGQPRRGAEAGLQTQDGGRQEGVPQGPGRLPRHPDHGGAFGAGPSSSSSFGLPASLSPPSLHPASPPPPPPRGSPKSSSPSSSWRPPRPPPPPEAAAEEEEEEEEEEVEARPPASSPSSRPAVVSPRASTWGRGLKSSPAPSWRPPPPPPRPPPPPPPLLLLFGLHPASSSPPASPPPTNAPPPSLRARPWPSSSLPLPSKPCSSLPPSPREAASPSSLPPSKLRSCPPPASTSPIWASPRPPPRGGTPKFGLHPPGGLRARWASTAPAGPASPEAVEMIAGDVVPEVESPTPMSLELVAESPAPGPESPRPRCVRSGCDNPPVPSSDWDNEYCSSECVVKHCRDVFLAWLAARNASTSVVFVK